MKTKGMEKAYEIDFRYCDKMYILFANVHTQAPCSITLRKS